MLNSGRKKKFSQIENDIKSKEVKEFRILIPKKDKVIDGLKQQLTDF